MVEASEQDAALFLDMLLAARDASDFVAGLDETAFLASKLHQNAIMRSIEIIGEAANRITPEYQAANPNIAWRDIIGMRHRLIHGYAEVRLDLVWAVVSEHLSELIPALEAAIRPDDGR